MPDLLDDDLTELPGGLLAGWFHSLDERLDPAALNAP